MMKTMKVIFISLLTIVSFNTYAQVTLASCETNAKDFMSTLSIAKTISTDCIPLIEATRNYINEDNSSDNFILITGYKNILFTKEYTLDIDGNTVLNANRFTAGNKTNITDIQAVDFVEENSKVYVLNKNGSDYSVLNFFYNISGNLSPSRVLNSSELSQATNLRADHTSQKIYVISSTNAWIKSFNLKADPNGKKPENSSSMVSNIFGSATTMQAPKDIAVKGSELFILDSDKVLVFNQSDDGSIGPKRSISGLNTTLSGSKKIKINANDEIEIINGDDTVVKFTLNGNGNIAPL